MNMIHRIPAIPATFAAVATGTVKLVGENAGPAATWLTAIIGIIGIIGVLVRDVVRRSQRQERIEESLRAQNTALNVKVAQLEAELKRIK